MDCKVEVVTGSAWTLGDGEGLIKIMQMMMGNIVLSKYNYDRLGGLGLE